MRTQQKYWFSWYIWFFGALFYGFEFLLQVSPNIMTKDLMQAFEINAETLGTLAAFYYYSNVCMQIPAGVFLDYLGPRKLLTISCGVCALGALIFGASTALYQSEFGRLLIGLGSAFAVLGTFKLAANWFPPQRFAFVTGVTVMIGMLGAVSAGAPLAYFVQKSDWRTVMHSLAMIGFIITILIWMNVKDKPKDAPQMQCESSSQLGLFQGLLNTFKKSQNWMVALYGGLMFAPTSAFAGLWGTPFLMEKYGYSRTVAAGAISMIFIGWAVGAPLIGAISDSMRKRKPTLYMASIGGFITMLFIIFAQMPIYFLYIILFAFGFLCSGFLPAFSIIREINPINCSATALGFMNAMNMIGGLILLPLIGFFLDLQWTGGIVNHVRVYSGDAYNIALLILPAILLLSLVFVPLINETHSKSYDERIYEENLNNAGAPLLQEGEL